MPKGGRAGKASGAAPDSNLLQEPSLIALRKQLVTSSLREQQVVIEPSDEPSGVSAGEPTVLLSGVGAPPGGGCELSSALLLRHSAYYQHASSFGEAPAAIALGFGHRAVALLAAVLRSGTALLGPATVADLLQAASYLQVAVVLQAAERYLQEEVLDSHSGLVLRVALDLQLAGLAHHIEQDFLQHFFMLSGDKAAAMLREWPPPQRRQLLHSPQLCAPTECCLVETLCHLAKAASSAEAAALLDCVRFGAMSAHEVAAAALYLQANAKWADRRLCTALTWRLLSARVAADLAGEGQAERRRDCEQLAIQKLQQLQGEGGCRGSAALAASRPAAAAASAEAAAEAGAGPGAGPRRVARRALHYGLRTASLEGWSGTTMYCAQRAIPCTWAPARPMVLQLEREDPRHAAAEAACGTSGGGGGATGGGGTGWDLQLSMDPHTFPAGFRATCFAFGADGLYWCALGPLSKPGPTWWKVGFLASQMAHALPLALLGGSGGGGGGEGGLLLVGWWVPEQ